MEDDRLPVAIALDTAGLEERQRQIAEQIQVLEGLARNAIPAQVYQQQQQEQDQGDHETSEIPPPKKGYRMLAICALQILLVIAVPSFLLGRWTATATSTTNPLAMRDDASPQPTIETTGNPSFDPTNAPSSTDNTNEPASSPCDTNVKCFETSQELQIEIDKYLIDGGESSERVYGYPIGCWCVSKITNFAGFLREIHFLDGSMSHLLTGIHLQPRI